MSLELEVAPQPTQDRLVDEMVKSAEEGDDKVAADAFWKIVETTLDKYDLQASRVELLRDELDRMIAPFMKHPVESIRAEFKLLEMLYEDRTVTNEDSSLLRGAKYTEFVTRKQDSDTIDHRFKIIDQPNGSRWLVDEMASSVPGIKSYTVAVKDDELSISKRYYAKGGWHDDEITPDTEDGKQVLSHFFNDTIVAAHRMFLRTPEEIDDFNARAKHLLELEYADWL